MFRTLTLYFEVTQATSHAFASVDSNGQLYLVRPQVNSGGMGGRENDGKFGSMPEYNSNKSETNITVNLLIKY